MESKSLIARARNRVAGRRFARTAAALVAVAALPAGLAACTTPPPTGTGNTVLLIGGTFAPEIYMASAVSYLEARGHRVETMALEGLTPGTAATEDSGAAVCRRIEQLAASGGKVDAAGHSQGSMAARWCFKNRPATAAKVGTFISVGGVDNGTTMAYNCALLGQGCLDMQPNSRFLRQLNADDPTPGDITYLKVYSNPASGGFNGEDWPLPDAVNVSVQSLCRGKSLSHASEYSDDTVQAMLDAGFSGREFTTNVC